ncbi:LysR family transcriptional regulator [Paraburkholderia bengalensis]|uniref:LysR family transcriptional regulator n=1 Tax=Paraburkholderia bengalensis TaxID=2747562 RepID=A0ABU8ILW3_9BURK
MPNLRKKLPSANALFVFEAAARCGNFTRAAQELVVSQPAVSRMLARMEDHLGVRLFERMRGGIELTGSGKILYRAISEGFNGIENAISEIEARATGVEPVTLSVSTGFATHWLMPRMSRLNRAFPHVDLRFQLLASRDGGPVNDVDLGMRFLHDSEIDEHALLLMPETWVPVCSERYLEAAEADAGDAHGDTLLVADQDHDGWQTRFNTLVQQGRCTANTSSPGDCAAVVQAALLGEGIAAGWLDVVSHWLARGALRPAHDDVIVTDRRCCLVRPANKPLRPLVDRLRDWLLEEMHSDLLAIDKHYPKLGLRDAMQETGLRFA